MCKRKQGMGGRCAEMEGMYGVQKGVRMCEKKILNVDGDVCFWNV